MKWREEIETGNLQNLVAEIPENFFDEILENLKKNPHEIQWPPEILEIVKIGEKLREQKKARREFLNSIENASDVEKISTDFKKKNFCRNRSAN